MKTKPKTLIGFNNWKPLCNKEALITRSELLRAIREFFYRRNVIEVETPLLCGTTGTDPYINSVHVCNNQFNQNKHVSDANNQEQWQIDYLQESNQQINNKDSLYLQTSPEFAMKRLLASDAMCMFQICKSFRKGEISPNHNLEFTILEWYRVGYNDEQLIQEVSSLLQETVNAKPAIVVSYKDLFLKYLNINPHKVDLKTLQNIAKNQTYNSSDFNSLNFDESNSSKLNLSEPNLNALNFNKSIPISFSDSIMVEYEIDDWLNFYFNQIIQPNLIGKHPWIVYHYPASQAMLSQKTEFEGDLVAKRFEVFYKGLELGNGYHELQCPKEQLARFKDDNKKRKELNLPEIPIDNNFIEALNHGLPNCAGIAIGIDRLLMALMDVKDIRSVISFAG